MFHDQLIAINGGYKPAWKFNGSLMDINGEQEQTEAFDRFVERIYHEENAFPSIITHLFQ